LLTLCDEIQNYGGAHKSNDKLKSIITQTELAVEKKGHDIYTVSDYNNYIFLTNNDWPIKVEASDRRFLLLGLDNGHANDNSYFKPLVAQLNDEAAEHFHWLAQRDLTEWNSKDIPMTDLKKQLKVNSLAAPYQVPC